MILPSPTLLTCERLSGTSSSGEPFSTCLRSHCALSPALLTEFPIAPVRSSRPASVSDSGNTHCRSAERSVLTLQTGQVNKLDGSESLQSTYRLSSEAESQSLDGRMSQRRCSPLQESSGPRQ